MKNIKYIILIITGLFFTACEKVVSVDLDTAAPRLVVEASIDWVKGTDGSHQEVKLTKTTGYYSKDIPVVSGATVFITNTAGTIFTFAETPGTGLYVCDNFVPQINETYVLNVLSEGQTYTATEKLYAVPEISRVIQDNEGGIFNEDIEVRFFFQDNGAEDNFYLTRFSAPQVLPFPEFAALDDRFNQGNEMFNFFSHEDLEPGHAVNIEFYGISKRYYNYMEIVISLIEGGAGSGPFQTPPVNVRGNIINQTDSNNFAVGYFRVCETSTLNYIVQ